MKTLSKLTQTHLSVLFFDATSHNPVPRMPVYGEASVISILGPYVINPEEMPLHLEPALARRVLQTLASRMHEHDYQNLGSEGLRQLRQALESVFIESNVTAMGAFEGMSDEKIESTLKDFVDQALVSLDRPFDRPVETRVVSSHPLGTIATDHAGYASFDLRKLASLRSVSNPAGAGGQLGPSSSATEFAFYIYPMGREEHRLAVLDQSRLSPDAVFAKFAIATPAFTPSLKVLNLPSMQNPDLVDWYLSPGSFATKPEFLIGGDGCETLMPAQLALSQFNFRQVVRVANDPRTPGGTPENWPSDIGPIPTDARYAYVDEYQASWYALGHSLGEIQYSLPLAPGESVKLAVIDWSWDSLTSREEKTKFTEEVLHQTHRDRTISETVKAAVDEWQRGGNFQAGVAGGSGAAGSSGGKGFSSGNAWSLGGGYSTSSGSRQLAADNVQKLSDSFVQASSAQRELNSTVVIQARQEEKESIQTRTFTNYNHSHTLTILYFEVLRHFKLEVEWVRRRPSILVPATPLSFSSMTSKDILKYRKYIEGALIDKSLAAAFAAMEKQEKTILKYKAEGIDIDNPKQPQVISEGDFAFSLFQLEIKTSDTTNSKVTVFVRKTDGKSQPLFFLYDGPHHPDDGANNLNVGRGSKQFDDMNSTMRFFVSVTDSPNTNPVPGASIKWRDIAGFEFEKWGNDSWRIDRLAIRAYNQFGQKIDLLPEGDVDLYFLDDEPSIQSISFITPPKENATPSERVPSVIQTLNADELFAIDMLRSHLVENAAYYQRQIYLNTPIETTQVHFDARPWNPPTSTYADHAEPIPLEMFGNYIAFPLLTEKGVAAIIDDPTLAKKAERLTTLPTRGVFAEGKLGHCNISEEIDNTRFWKWEEHPIPIQAPDIAPVQAVTPQPQQTNIAAGAFPAALLSIVNPSPAPDPTGLGDALKVMAASNIFRDMSGRTEVADLLKKLSDNSVAFANVAGNLTKPGSAGAPTSSAPSSGAGGGSSGGGGSTGTPGAGSGSGGSTSSPKVDPKTTAALSDAIKGMVGYASGKEVKEAMSALADLTKKQAQSDDKALSGGDSGGQPDIDAAAPSAIDQRRIPMQIQTQLSHYGGSSYAAGSVPHIVTSFVKHRMLNVWNGKGGIVGVHFTGEHDDFKEYLDHSVPTNYAAVASIAKSRIVESSSIVAFTQRFEVGGVQYCNVQFLKETETAEVRNYMARMAHEICHYILASSTAAIVADLRTEFFHADLAAADLPTAAKAREAFMNEVLGRRLNYLFHEATDTTVVHGASVKSLAKSCFNFAANDVWVDGAGNPFVPDYYKPIKDIIRDKLTTDDHRRHQVGLWLQNFWTKEVLFDDAGFDRRLKTEFNSAGHFLRTTTQAEFDAVSANGLS